jgi:hypothetical protein
MKKKPSPLKRWLTLQIEEAIRLRKLGASVMLPVAVVVALLNVWLFNTAIWLFSEDISPFMTGVYSMLLVGLQFVVYQLLVGQRISTNYDYAEGADGGGRLASWLWVLFLPAPRTLGLALECKALATRLEQLDLVACSKAIVMVMKAQGRVLVDDVIVKHPTIDPELLVRWLSDIDGVVIVRRQGLGLTLTPTFTEEYEKWFNLNDGEVPETDADLF